MRSKRFIEIANIRVFMITYMGKQNNHHRRRWTDLELTDAPILKPGD